jgi:hypothetical protein
MNHRATAPVADSRTSSLSFPGNSGDMTKSVCANNTDRHMKLLAILLLVTTVAAYSATPPADDAELARRLVGTWITDPADKSPAVSTVTYNSDGTGSELVRLREQPESASVRVTTRWSIKEGILTLKSVASSDPEKIPVGLELKDRIISISADRFEFEAYAGYGDGKGTRGVKVRKK